MDSPIYKAMTLMLISNDCTYFYACAILVRAFVQQVHVKPFGTNSDMIDFNLQATLPPPAV